MVSSLPTSKHIYQPFNHFKDFEKVKRCCTALPLYREVPDIAICYKAIHNMVLTCIVASLAHTSNHQNCRNKTRDISTAHAFLEQNRSKIRRLSIALAHFLDLFTADKFSNSYMFWLTISFLIPLPLNDPKVDTKVIIYGRGARACRAAENDVTRISYRYINIKTDSRQLYGFHFSFCHALRCLLIPLGTAAIRPSRRKNGRKDLTSSLEGKIFIEGRSLQMVQ